MNKLKRTLERFEEILDSEAKMLEKAISSTKQDIRESVESYIKLENAKEDYRKFYASKLKEACAKSENDMDEETKEKFKSDIEESWKGESFDEETLIQLQKEASSPEFKSDDPRESEEQAKGKPNVTDENGEVIDPTEGGIESPVVSNEGEDENDDAAPADPTVDDQTDVITKTEKPNLGEEDTTGDPLK